MTLPIIEQVKIQAQILVPLVKALQAKLGERRANALVRRALGDIYRRYGKNSGGPRARRTLATSWRLRLQRSGAGRRSIIKCKNNHKMSSRLMSRGCRYAAFYRELGEPELGFLLVCSADFLMTEGLDPDITLTRTQTIRQGASHCDFRYRRQRD